MGNDYNNSNDDDMSFVWTPTWMQEAEESDFVEQTNVVSGMGIVEEDDNVTSINDLLNGVNMQNAEIREEEEARLRKETEEREAEENRLREEARAKIYQEQYEEEKRERERLEKEREEEEKRLAEEAEAKRKANPLYKMKDAASKSAATLQEKMTKAAEVRAEEKAEKERLLAEKAEQEAEKKKAEEETAKKEKPGKVEKIKEEKPKKEKPEKKKKPEKETNAPDFKYLATHDQLTGLKNLTAYELEVAECDPSKLAILFFDINDLKITNDTKGHSVGNKLITTVAQHLEKLFPEKCYRIGGDEFIVLYQGSKKAETLSAEVEEKIKIFKNAMSRAAERDADDLKYSVSVGYAVGDGKKNIEELKDEADQLMYKNKKEYKDKELEKKTGRKKVEVDKDVDYDSLLSSEQRMLKEVIKENHCQASEESTEKIMRELQSRANEIIAVLIASKNFDSLFIVQDVDLVIETFLESENLMDYSYVYAVYETGTQFYGIDEYYDEVTDLFKEIGFVIKTMPSVTSKELLKIKGINIFKQIYFD